MCLSLSHSPSFFMVSAHSGQPGVPAREAAQVCRLPPQAHPPHRPGSGRCCSSCRSRERRDPGDLEGQLRLLLQRSGRAGQVRPEPPSGEQQVGRSSLAVDSEGKRCVCQLGVRGVTFAKQPEVTVQY